MNRQFVLTARIAVAAQDKFEARTMLNKLFESEPNIEMAHVAFEGARDGCDLNAQRHNDVALEAYIHAARSAMELLRSTHQDMIVLRGDVDDELREDADLSALGKLTAAEAALAGAVRYHETGSV